MAFIMIAFRGRSVCGEVWIARFRGSNVCDY